MQAAHDVRTPEPYGADARDWDAIRDWAQRLPDRLGLAVVGAAR